MHGQNHIKFENVSVTCRCLPTLTSTITKTESFPKFVLQVMACSGIYALYAVLLKTCLSLD